MPQLKATPRASMIGLLAEVRRKRLRESYTRSSLKLGIKGPRGTVRKPES